MAQKQNKVPSLQGNIPRIQRGGGGGGMGWEFGISRHKLVHTEWINNKVLLCSTGNCIQYLVITYNRKGSREVLCVRVWNRITLVYP